MIKFLQAHRFIFGIFLGVMLTLSLAPFYIVPLLIISLSGLLYIIHSAQNLKQALMAAYGFGIGFNASALFWVSLNFLYLPGPAHPPNYFMGVPVAILSFLGLSFGLGLFTLGFGFLSYHLPIKGLKGLTLQAVAWGWIFLVQGHIFSGFPWPPLAIATSFHPILMQPAALVGTYGLSFMVAWVGFSAFIWRQGFSQRQIIIFLGIIVLVIFASTLRYIHVKNIMKNYDGEKIQVRLVQPSITMRDKWNEDLFEQNVTLISDMLKPSADSDGYDLVILGETALPILVEEDMNVRKTLTSSLPKGAYLLIGTHTRANFEPSKPNAFYNSMIGLDHNNQLVMKYHKRKLVPFGEYTPGRSLIDYFWPYQGGLEQGKKNETFYLDNISFNPNICYEGIFSGEILAKEPLKVIKQQKPQLLINISIDGWYRNTHGVRQNAAMQRFRALEEGINYIRVSDIGISFIVDASGSIIKKINYNNADIVEERVSLYEIKTINSYFNKIFLFIIFSGLIILCWKPLKRNHN